MKKTTIIFTTIFLSQALQTVCSEQAQINPKTLTEYERNYSQYGTSRQVGSKELENAKTFISKIMTDELFFSHFNYQTLAQSLLVVNKNLYRKNIPYILWQIFDDNGEKTKNKNMKTKEWHTNLLKVHSLHLTNPYQYQKLLEQAKKHY